MPGIRPFECFSIKTSFLLFWNISFDVDDAALNSVNAIIAEATQAKSCCVIN